MNISKHVFTVTLLFLAVATFTPSAEGQSYGGRATGVTATVNNGTPANYVFADTGQLPASGGNISISVPSSFIPGVMVTGVLTASTSGALRSSQSVTVANDVDIQIGGVRIRANRVTANSGCICCPGVGDGTCGGSTVFNGLTITDQAGTVTNVSVTGEANQVVTLPNGVGTLTLNQQITGTSSITVNGMRVDASVNGTVYTAVVATASSSIECLIVAPTPTEVTVSGRVLDRYGRAISKTTVTLTDGTSGATRSTITNSFGQYAFDAVEAGRTYVLNASHRSYSFSAKAFTANDNDMSVDLIAN